MFFPNTYGSKRKEKSSLPALVTKYKYFRGRTSPFTSGSLTLEAACVLPLFLGAMVTVMIFIQGTRLSCQVSEGLHEAGKQMALVAYAKEVAGVEAGKYVTGALSYVFAQGKVKEKTDKEISGLLLLRSKIMDENEIIDLVAEYALETPISFFETKGLKMVQRARIRAWTGRKDAYSGEENSEQEGLVYVTVNGSVYHKDRECSHIRLSIQNVMKASIKELRNKSGGKYYPCSGCDGDTANQVYITDTGDKYHSSIACSGLKRGVISMTLADVSKWSPCSRCGE